MAAPVGHEEDVAVLAEKLPQLGFPARLLLAAVVIEDGAERAVARRLVDEPVELQLAAGKGNLFRLAGRGGRDCEAERERPARRSLGLLHFGE